MNRKIKVLIIDDSAVVRHTLSLILQSDPDIEVIGTAQDPYVAAKRMLESAPDVITLDIEMPRMDGLAFLQKLMSQHPLPVVMCSSLSDKNCDSGLRALELGAVEVITKPKLGVQQFLEESRIQLCDTVKAAALSKVRRVMRQHPEPVQKKLDADVMMPKPKGDVRTATEKMIVVGASTGGTEALAAFFRAMPADAPAVAVVQHMPEKFTASLAHRLNALSRMTVKEAASGDAMARGQALLAPGGYHMMLKRSGSRYYVEIQPGPLVSRHKPSVDVLFRSAATYAGPNAVGVIMTGMGDDGAKGMLELKQAGAITFAQDEATCVVFGMPKEAIGLGGVDKVCPLERLAPEAIRACAGGCV